MFSATLLMLTPSSPAMAAATRHLGFGYTSSIMQYHPFTFARLISTLDHLTRGRAMLGVGPGALGSDAYMLGIDPLEQIGRAHV